MTISPGAAAGIRACLPAAPILFFIFLGFGMASQSANVPALAALLAALAWCRELFVSRFR